MLYDILPPLTLLASFAGIIIIVSRVVLRMRRQHISHQIQAQTASTSSVDDTFFKPGKRSVTLVANRLALIPHMVVNTKSNMRNFIASRREKKEKQLLEKQEQKKEIVSADVPEGISKRIRIPSIRWRERLSSVSELSKQGARGAKKRFQDRFKKEGTRSDVTEKVEQQSFVKESSVLPLSHATEEQADMTKKKGGQTPRLKRVLQAEPPDTQDGEEISKGKTRTIVNLFGKKEPGRHSALDQALTAIEKAQYDRAEDILIPHIVQHARDVRAYMLLGQAELGREAWDEAVEIFEQVLRIDPSHKGVRAKLGYAALQNGRMTLALQSLQRAHDEDPTSEEVLNNLLTIAQRMDNKVLKSSVSDQLSALKNAPERVK